MPDLPRRRAAGTILGLTRYAVRATFRNRVGYFFSLVFPLLFVFSFGLAGDGRHRLRLGLDQAVPASSPLRRELEAAAGRPDALLELVVAPAGELERQVARGRLLGAVCVDPGGNEAGVLVTSSADPAARVEAEAFLSGLLLRWSLERSAAGPGIRQESRQIPGRARRHIDFILPGQIGFSMLSLATFGMGFTLMTLRKTLVIKRIVATTVSPLHFVIALGLGRSVQALFQTTVLLAVGVLAFRFTLADGMLSALQVLVLAYVGILAFLGFGILIANVARDEQTLPVVMNLFNLPQILLCGVFFPTEDLPAGVRWLGENLPLAYLNHALRLVALDGGALWDAWPQLGGMVLWGAAAYLLAARTFATE